MKTRTANTIFWATVALALVASIAKADVSIDIKPATPLSGQEAQRPGATTAAALLDKAASTLSSASSLTADFEEIDSYPTPYKDLAQRGTLTLARPGQLRVEIKRFRRITAADPWTPSGNDALSVSDGKTYSYAFLHPHSTQIKQETSSTQALTGALKAAPAIAGFFAPVSTPADASLLATETWEGEQYQVVDYKVNGDHQTFDAHAYVGEDGLVHRLVYKAETPRGTLAKEWVLRNVKLNQSIPGSIFAYTPPADATPLDGSDRPAPLAVGAVAPDFAVKDARGKTVKLSDFRGKTVILDFWATWCWPCNQSLPHTEAVVAQNGDKNVVALAVAIWDSQTGFDAWIGKHNYPDIRFAIDPSPQGKDVASALYHIPSTPTAYVIDPAGKIVDIVSGYAGPTDELQAAIDTAVSSKTARVNP